MNREVAKTGYGGATGIRRKKNTPSIYSLSIKTISIHIILEIRNIYPFIHYSFLLYLNISWCNG
jgi:hypothetical protein